MRRRLGISPATLRRRLTGVTRYRFKGGYAVRWRDIEHLFE